MKDPINETLTETKLIKTKVSFNPFPGLRPFGIGESHLFFGREGQSDEVVKYLSKYRFAAVTGASGSGKSSLIYCGLIPLLHGGFIVDAGTKWRVITTRPGNNPIENLADAIVQSESQTHPENINEFTKTIILTVLKRSFLGLVDALKQLKGDKDENFLIIFDQFEELFRFKESRKDSSSINETEAYIKLFVEAVKQVDFPVYVVLTMRSDFVGECSQFHDLTGLINNSNYLIPQMTREDFRKAIVGPVRVGNAKIDPQLVQQLLNHVGSNTDQLSVLQHALMRTWEHWSKYNAHETPISIRNYESIGKMDQALSLHADEAYEELSPEKRVICEKMFKTITERGTDNRGIRQPTRVDVIARIANCTTEDIIDVANKFRMKGRSFLTPSMDTELTKDTVIDISHESIMRIWDRLKIWVEEEAQAVQMYLRLADASAMYQVGKTGLWRPPDLHLAIKWKQKQNPTLIWAKRYNPAYERAMVFLETSEKKFKAEERNKVRLQKRVLKRTQTFALIMLVATMGFFALSIFAYRQKQIADEQRKIAEELRDDAVEKKNVAVERSIIAQEQKTVAEMEKELAERQKREAEYLSKLSEQQKLLAEQRQEEALKESERAQAEKIVAEQQKVEAQKTAEEAVQEKTQAELEKEREYRRRMLSISQSMAIKSLTVEDSDLKGLLSLQAFKFNEEFNGEDNNNDIYAGLYNTIKTIRGVNFNRLQGHDEDPRALVFIPGKNVCYSTGGDGKIIEWDFRGGSINSSRLFDNEYINYSLAISNDGRWLAAGTFDSYIQVFDLSSKGNAPRLINTFKGSVNSVSFTPNNEIIAVSSQSAVKKWNVKTLKSTTIDSIDSKIRVTAVAPSGRQMVAGTFDGKVILWDLRNNSSSIIFQPTNNSIYSVAFSNDGYQIAVGDKYGNIRIFNTTTKRLIASLKGHNRRILDIKFSPDDRLIASSSMDGTVQIWENGKYNQDPIVLNDHESWVFSLAFSADNKSLITTSRNNNLLFIYPTQADYIADYMCRLLKRNMTEAEWAEFVGFDISYAKTCPNIAK